MTGLMDDQVMGWSVCGQHFELAIGAEASTLSIPGLDGVHLSNTEWLALADVVSKLLSSDPMSKVKRKTIRSASVIRPQNVGHPWTDEMDAQLLRRWNDEAATIPELMAEFDRNEGGIAARLVRLGVLSKRSEVISESRKREETLKTK